MKKFIVTAMMAMALLFSTNVAIAQEVKTKAEKKEQQIKKEAKEKNVKRKIAKRKIVLKKATGKRPKWNVK